MQLTLVFTVTFLLLSSSPAHAQTESSSKDPSQIKTGMQRLMKQVNNFRDKVVSALRNVLSITDSFVDSVGNKVNRTQQTVQHNIDKLRRDYGAHIYDPCFPGRMPLTFVDHYFGGVQICIDDTLQSTLNTGKTVARKIDAIIVILNGIPEEIGNCKRSGKCYLRLTRKVMINIPMLVGQIAYSVTKTITLVATLHTRIVPCGAVHGEFDDWAKHSVGNITNCVTKIGL